MKHTTFSDPRYPEFARGIGKFLPEYELRRYQFETGGKDPEPFFKPPMTLREITPLLKECVRRGNLHFFRYLFETREFFGLRDIMEFLPTQKHGLKFFFYLLGLKLYSPEEWGTLYSRIIYRFANYKLAYWFTEHGADLDLEQVETKQKWEKVRPPEETELEVLKRALTSPATLNDCIDIVFHHPQFHVLHIWCWWMTWKQQHMVYWPKLMINKVFEYGEMTLPQIELLLGEFPFLPPEDITILAQTLKAVPIVCPILFAMIAEPDNHQNLVLLKARLAELLKEVGFHPEMNEWTWNAWEKLPDAITLLRASCWMFIPKYRFDLWEQYLDRAPLKYVGINLDQILSRWPIEILSVFKTWTPCIRVLEFISTHTDDWGNPVKLYFGKLIVNHPDMSYPKWEEFKFDNDAIFPKIDFEKVNTELAVAITEHLIATFAANQILAIPEWVLVPLAQLIEKPEVLSKFPSLVMARHRQGLPSHILFNYYLSDLSYPMDSRFREVEDEVKTI